VSFIPAFEFGLWNAWLFMSIFILQMIAVILLGKRMLERTGHPTTTRQSRIERYSGIAGNAIWLGATIYSIFLPFQLGTFWFYAGLVTFLTGFAILVLSTINFATASDEKPVTNGVYSLSRHPGYLSLILVYIAVSVAAASWVFLILAIANIYWIRIEALLEERYCLEKYGDEYQHYMETTPRWIGIPK
jgi:protein-S-isoprenylcysteine O-methyltransferase Ste14